MHAKWLIPFRPLLSAIAGAVAHAKRQRHRTCDSDVICAYRKYRSSRSRCRAAGAKWKYPHGPEHLPKGKKLSVTDGFKGEVAFPSHHISHQVFDVIKEGSQGRPDIYMWYCYQPVYSNPQVEDNIAILKDEKILPFTVCISPFYDESAALADLILPDATYTERWDWEDHVAPNQISGTTYASRWYNRLLMCATLKMFCIELADRLGFPLGYPSAEEFVRRSCELTPAVQAVGGFDYMIKHGVHVNPKDKPYYYGYKKTIGSSKLNAAGVLYALSNGCLLELEKIQSEKRSRSSEKRLYAYQICL